MFLRAPLLFLLTACLASPAFPQVLGSSSIAHPGVSGSISGSVQTADGQPVSDARVELRSNTGTVASSGYTNSTGRFEFQNIAVGTYEIVADSGVDEARDSVSVQGDLATVSLRLPRVGGSSSAGNNSTVSVAQMKVPEKARDEDKKAREYLQKHDVAAAWKHVAKALQITPQFASALTTRALLELDNNQSDAAIADLEKAVQFDAGYGLSFLVLGSAYNQLQRFDDAIRALDHGVALMPNYWQGYFELGKAYLGKNDLAHAQAQLDRCKQHAPPDYAPLHLVRANLELALKNFPAAMTELEAYLDRDPNGANSTQARKTLGEVKAFLSKGSEPKVAAGDQPSNRQK
jgi:tetratricopeptide (TPR) repeat protein